MSELERLMKQSGKKKFFNIELAKKIRKFANCSEDIKKGEKCLRFQSGKDSCTITANLCVKCLENQMSKIL